MPDDNAPLSREAAYVEIMVLMAMADGRLQDEEALRLAQTVASRREFAGLDEDALDDLITGALRRQRGADPEERVEAIGEALGSESARFKALVFAYAILVADGVVDPGELAALGRIESRFGLELVPGASVPRQKRAELTRKRLLEAGQQLFAADGYHATSSKKIARFAGVAVGSFYNHFEDKKALLLAIMGAQAQARRARVLDATAILARESDPQVLASSFVALCLELQPAVQELGAERAALSRVDPDVSKLAAAEQEHLVQLLLTVLNGHRDALRQADAEAAVRLVVGVVLHALEAADLDPDGPVPGALAAPLADLVWRYLFA